MDFLKLGREEYEKLLERDPKLIQMDICLFITHLKKKDNSSATILSYVSGINKFLVMNDVLALNWKHVKVAEDRPYTHVELKNLACCDP